MTNRLTMTPEEIRETLDELERAGEIIKTGEIHNGLPVYKAVQNATEEELRAARERKN